MPTDPLEFENTIVKCQLQLAAFNLFSNTIPPSDVLCGKQNKNRKKCGNSSLQSWMTRGFFWDQEWVLRSLLHVRQMTRMRVCREDREITSDVKELNGEAGLSPDN